MYRGVDDITRERWAIRLATLSPTTPSNAEALIFQFHSAGGDQELFDKIERVALEKGHDLATLIARVVDLKLIARKPLPPETINRFVSAIRQPYAN